MPTLSTQHEHSPSTKAALGGLVVLNLLGGLWLLSQPDRTFDLHRVVGWARLWHAGLDPYLSDDLVDYPPWALVILWPLTLIPRTALMPVWVLANIAMLIAIARVLVRRSREPRPMQIALALLLLSTAAARTWTQFSALSFALATFALFSARSIPVMAMLAGLALLKPQIGGVALAWWLLRRRWLPCGLALLVPALLTVVFAIRLQVAPLDVIDRYARVLIAVHGTSDPLPGHTELRAWLVHVWPDFAGHLCVSFVLAIALFLPAIVRARSTAQWADDEALEMLAWCGAVSLIAFRHLSYDFILLWPAVIAWRRWTPGFVVLAGLLILELPGWARLAAAAGAPHGVVILTQFDRLLALAVWAVLASRFAFARAAGRHLG